MLQPQPRSCWPSGSTRADGPASASRAELEEVIPALPHAVARRGKGGSEGAASRLQQELGDGERVGGLKSAADDQGGSRSDVTVELSSERQTRAWFDERRLDQTAWLADRDAYGPASAWDKPERIGSGWRPKSGIDIDPRGPPR